MYRERKEIYERIENALGAKIIVYVTSDRRGLETQIHEEVLDYFADHLDTIGVRKKITLVLYSRGGQTLAGWSIANLIRQFCDEFEVIIPSKAHSTATLIALSASKIMMTKQATLGPIDPSVNTPLNPQVPDAPANARIPISVEDVAGYFSLAKDELKIKSQSELTEIIKKLSDHVHPLALGNVYRARAQIQMLADKLLGNHIKNRQDIKKIISFICSESGSHDYTINRKEARKLGLPIVTPSEKEYNLIKELYDNIRMNLKLKEPFNLNVELKGNNSTRYSLIRGLIESIKGGSHQFNTEGNLEKIVLHNGQQTIGNTLHFEGWKHEK